MRSARSPLAAALVAIALCLGACGGSAGGVPSDDELADQEPEEALAEMPGVADVGREYDVEEDEYYVNEVIVDTEPDVSVDELVAIIDVMSFYDREGVEEPVNGTLYIDAGTTEWSPTPERTALLNEAASEEVQRSRAEALIAAERELPESLVVINEGSLQVTVDSPVEVAEAATKVEATSEFDAFEMIGVYQRDEADSATGLALSLGPGFGERSLSAYTQGIAAPIGGKAELDAFSIRRASLDSDAAEVSACVRTRTFNTPRAADITVDEYEQELGPLARALVSSYSSLPDGSTLELSAFVPAEGQFTRCDPLIAIAADGTVERDPLDRGWEELANEALRD